jgi:hypothetical protein
MSLDFRVTKIENYDELYPAVEVDTWHASGSPAKMKDWHPRTVQIVWGCMSTGIGELKESNVAEWYARYTIWCQTHNLDVELPYKHVIQHIGLTTNVFPEETRSKWLKRIVGGQLDDTKRSAEYDRSHNNDTYNGVKKEKTKA